MVKKQKKRKKRDVLEEQVCKGMRKKGGRVGKNEKEGWKEKVDAKMGG